MSRIELPPGPGPAPWAVDRRSGSADDLHRASAQEVAAPFARAIRVVHASAPAVVLGSAEPAAHVDRDRARAAGCGLARRRSGGAAVLVGPGLALWIDVLLPRHDPLWDDDVGRAGWWLGAAWVRALAAVGVGDAEVHHGAFLRRPWSERVCFAGLGPGEVVAGGAKVVGIAQRRTRHGALFQCAVAEGPRPGWAPWDPGGLLAVLALSDDERGQAARDLAGAAIEVGARSGLEESFLAAVHGMP